MKTLSKTRFRLALECPTKVYYSLDKRYANLKQDDEFLESLADGGFQVGALAKEMYRVKDPGAIEITSMDQDQQVRQTAELLQRENVTIFEGTIRYDNLLIRIDVLQKRGLVVDLIEVKAKSWDRIDDSLTGKTARSNPIAPNWEPFVYDVAFQHRVLSLACPSFTIRPWLLLVDKARVNTIDGLALKFPIRGSGRSRWVEVSPDFNVANLEQPLLWLEDASAAVNVAQTIVRERKGRADIQFDALITAMSSAITRGERLGPFVGQPCKACEFYVAPAAVSTSNRSGWTECMETQFKGAVLEPREHSVFGFYRQAKIDAHLAPGHLWMRQVELADLNVKASAEKISMTARHELQWREVKEKDNEPFLNEGPLRAAMGDWRFPLHFIDFETTRPVLPYHAGQRPYQQILFQFSHHEMSTDGTVRHATECLLTDGTAPPSIAVTRRLLAAIGQDDGTVLHWYPHERTVLNDVADEIKASAPGDAVQLLHFFGELGLEKDSKGRLYDMGRMVEDQVFLPGTGGSSSMKRFLPAVLRHSAAVRERYSMPIYGTTEMPSHNFMNQTWVVDHSGTATDPYKLLSPLFQDFDLTEALERMESGEGEVVANGAKAMIAYATLQDPASPPEVREALHKQLLRYCELDTLAMVMVYQALVGWLRH